ncbi:MAG: twin-arginine translocation signal domain-containing protein [Patescibacteria group bacterium]|jgi:hypothetical protein
MANRKENQPTKEKKGFTRRQFLKGALALGASALVGSGCQPETPSSQPEKSPTDQPSKTPTKEVSPTSLPTATEEPTGIPTPEVTPTPEAKLLEGVDIDREYLQNAFTGIGGGETIDNGGKEVSFAQFGQDYVRRSWGEEIDFASLSEDSITSLKYLVSLGAYQGRLGFFCPGKEGETIAFPGLVEDKEGQEKPLTLLRLELENLPSKDPSGEDYSEWTFPQGLELLRDTQMTVLGYLEQDREGKLVIDQGKEGSELVYALTAFTDYNRADEDSGAPRHYLALLPTHFPADPDNKQALTLANLLEGNGYDYDPVQRAVSFVDPDTDQKTIWQLNKLVGQDLSSDLYRAAGLTFVDQLDGEQIKNPILPYPQGVQDRYQLEREDNQFIFTGQNEEGKEITFKASYDQEKEAWGWEEMGGSSAEDLLNRAPIIEGLSAFEEGDKIIYRAESGNPYNMKEGEYAGYLFEFDDETSVSSGQGLVLAGEVRRRLLEQANTPEAIERGEWRMTFPFDPKGEGITIRHIKITVNSIGIANLPNRVEFRSPFIEAVLAKRFFHQTRDSVGLWIPENLLADSQKGINYSLGFTFVSAEKVTMDNFGRKVNFDELIFANIDNSYLSHPSVSSDNQIIITGGSLRGPIDFSVNRILMIDDAPVFSLDNE